MQLLLLAWSPWLPTLHLAHNILTACQGLSQHHTWTCVCRRSAVPMVPGSRDLCWNVYCFQDPCSQQLLTHLLPKALTLLGSSGGAPVLRNWSPTSWPFRNFSMGLSKTYLNKPLYLCCFSSLEKWKGSWLLLFFILSSCDKISEFSCNPLHQKYFIFLAKDLFHVKSTMWFAKGFCISINIAEGS